jgi:hypothetical protein
MKSIVVLTLIFLTVSCQQKSGTEDALNHDQPDPVVVNDTIPLTRSTVNKKAVAGYSEKIKDPLNNWKFAVQLYETPATFQYLIDIEYMSLREKDTVSIPNFGIMPEVAVQKGENPLSCIIGFYDKEKNFMPYKKVAVTNSQLKITTVQHYARTRYKVK